MFVYLITNKITGKQYVGQTAHTVEQRWKEHLKASKRGNIYYFHKSIRKYGSDAFEVKTLHICINKEELDFVEMFYISFLGTKIPMGYNSTDGGEGTIGLRVSEETRKKLSKANLGKIPSEETLAKMSTSQRGKKKTAETKKKLSESLKGNTNGSFTAGKAWTDEHREIHSKAMKNRNIPPESRLKMGSNRGKKMSKENLSALIAINTGRVVSEETKNRISLANTGKKRNEEAKSKMREAWVRRKANAG